MQITIVNESKYYVVIKAPEGTQRRFADLLPLLDTLRDEHALRFLYVHTRPDMEAFFICEKMNGATP